MLGVEKETLVVVDYRPDEAYEGVDNEEDESRGRTKTAFTMISDVVLNCIKYYSADHSENPFRP